MSYPNQNSPLCFSHSAFGDGFAAWQVGALLVSIITTEMHREQAHEQAQQLRAEAGA